MRARAKRMDKKRTCANTNGHRTCNGCVRENILARYAEQRETAGAEIEMGVPCERPRWAKQHESKSETYEKRACEHNIHIEYEG